MSHGRFVTTALLCGSLISAASAPVLGANTDRTALRAQVQSKLSAVTLDVDKANIMFSPSVGPLTPYYNRVRAEYSGEYIAALHRFQQAEYHRALKHLVKADNIIRQQSDWMEVE